MALPGLALLACLGLPGSCAGGCAAARAAGALYVVVALSWLTATLIAPANDRPWAIGSTNGSAWNAAFVFNGNDRLGGKSPEPRARCMNPATSTPTATQSERDHIPILPPSATRLLARVGPLSGQRLGLEVLIALLLGIPALLLGHRAARRGRCESERGDGPGRRRHERPGRAAQPRRPRRRQVSPTRAARTAADQARGSGRAEPVDAHGHRAVQPHGAAAPSLRRGLHAGRRRDARDRPRLGVARRAGGCASRALVVAMLATRLLRRAPARTARRRPGGWRCSARSAAIALGAAGDAPPRAGRARSRRPAACSSLALVAVLAVRRQSRRHRDPRQGQRRRLRRGSCRAKSSGR